MVQKPKNRKKKRRFWQFCTFFLVLLALGFTAVIALRSHLTEEPQNKTESENLIAQIEEIEKEINSLEQQVSMLLEESATNTLSQEFDAEAIAKLENENHILRQQGGFTEVSAEGVLIELNDNNEAAALAQKAVAKNYQPEKYIVHDTTLLALVNEIRPYANAIAINGHRIVASSTIRCVGTVIMVNQMRVAPPYQVAVAGDGSELMAVLKKLPSYDELLDGDILFTVSVKRDLIIPAYTGGIPQDSITIIPAN